MNSTLVIRGDRVVLPDGIRSASILIRDGASSRFPGSSDPAGVRSIDAGELVVMPGVVDTHVHINNPGRTDWEGFETATRAAAAGGVTTIVDMPLNSIPATTSVEALDAKRRAATGRASSTSGSGVASCRATRGARAALGRRRARVQVFSRAVWRRRV